MTAARSSRSRHRRPRRHALLAAATLAAATLAAATLAASCGGDEPATADPDPVAVPASSPTSPDATPDATTGPASSPAPDPTAATAAPATAATAAPASTDPAVAPTAPADACAALPSLELISATMGVTLTTTEALERGPGFDLCEAGGAADGVTTAQFTRLTDSSREQSIQLATELGATVVDLDDPALPGGFAYAGAAAIVVGDVEYTVQTFAMDTLGQMDSPVAVERSAALLVAWLAGLGVSP